MNRVKILTLLYVFIMIINIVTVGNPLNMVLSALQYAYVLYLILNGKISQALIFHITFTMTSLADTTVSAISNIVYNYAEVKLLNSFAVFYVMTGILFFLSIFKRQQLNDPLWAKLFRLLLFMFISGTIIGSIGIIFSDYFVEGMSYSLYLAVVLMLMYALKKNNSPEVLKESYDHAVALLLAGPIASLIPFLFLSIKTSYGGLDIMLSPDVARFSMYMLIFGSFFIKEKILLSISLLSVSLILITSGGGKSIISILIAVGYFIYYTLLNRNNKYLRVNKTMRFLSIALCIVLIIAFPVIMSNRENLFVHKFNEVVSLLNVFDNNLSQASASPYIRLATTANIFNEGLINPFYLLFGHGFGGYFTDSLHLMNTLDLTMGAWGSNIVALGKFPTAHDTFATVPLLNGFVVLGLLLGIIFLYWKRIKINFLASASIFWLLFTFYFNIELAVCGLFFLYASSYSETFHKEILKS